MADLRADLLASAPEGSLTSHTVGGGSGLVLLLISRYLNPSNHPRLAVFDTTLYLSMDSL